jgi:hypothetical protein
MANVDELRIGDFSKPVAPGAPAAEAQPSPTKAALDAAEKRLDADASKDEAVLKPMESYEDRLREVGVSKEEAADIIDSVLLKGHYSKEYSITKRIKVKFRTRGARDTKRATDMLESQRLTMASHYNESLGRYLLAASLESFGAEKLDHPGKGATIDDIEKAYASRLSYVENLSDPALRVLMQKLSVFDTMISTVLAEGTIENF